MVHSHSLITGGSSGIGFAVARKYVKRGHNITLIARNEARLKQARQELLALCVRDDQQISTRSADVSNEAEISKAVHQAINELGTPDTIILSAGVVSPGYFEDLKADAFKHDMSINYFGSLNTVRAVLPHLKAVSRGKILFVSSGAGLVGIFGYSAYSPSKFAVRGLAEVLRAELREDGISVSIAYPPDTQTPQLEKELLERPPETSAIVGKAKTWLADSVADKIVRGLDKRRFIIAPGGAMSALAFLHSLILPLLSRSFDRAALSSQTERPRNDT